MTIPDFDGRWEIFYNVSPLYAGGLRLDLENRRALHKDFALKKCWAPPFLKVDRLRGKSQDIAEPDRGGWGDVASPQRVLLLPFLIQLCLKIAP